MSIKDMIDALILKISTLTHLPNDKVGHAVIGAGLAVPLTVLLGPLDAVLLVLAAGIGKELSDYHANLAAKKKKKALPHSVEVLDVVATVIGGVIGVAIVLGLKYLL